MMKAAQFASLVAMLKAGDAKGFVSALDDIVEEKVQRACVNSSTSIQALADGVAAANAAPSVSGPVRSISATLGDAPWTFAGNAKVKYTLSLPIKPPILGSDESTVGLYIGGVLVSRARNKQTMNALGVLGPTGEPEWSVSGTVPAGQTCELVQLATSTNGQSAPSVTASQEELS